ncbi:hypothetical protein [Noviherbaspirillum galbum]|uniref:Uncharacterized protein n=1 Tax=Noviherbaspirillum galbum TaxID=2709383 RepID=A0A6B3SSA7_9BURK|nr:hypothetical protein [Noviherbaspirillum galbum]NEX61696.1 hypothetical protein [Noviherbaspirillum galbum]
MVTKSFRSSAFAAGEKYFHASLSGRPVGAQTGVTIPQQIHFGRYLQRFFHAASQKRVIVDFSQIFVNQMFREDPLFCEAAFRRGAKPHRYRAARVANLDVAPHKFSTQIGPLFWGTFLARCFLAKIAKTSS